MKKFTFATVIGLLLLTVACSDQGKGAISGSGTITYSSLEGGCWGISLDHGDRYEFRNLPEPYMEAGLRVRIAAKLSQGQASYCNAGDAVIDIIEIHRL